MSFKVNLGIISTLIGFCIGASVQEARKRKLLKKQNEDYKKFNYALKFNVEMMAKLLSEDNELAKDV